MHQFTWRWVKTFAVGSAPSFERISGNRGSPFANALLALGHMIKAPPGDFVAYRDHMYIILAKLDVGHPGLM